MKQHKIFSRLVENAFDFLQKALDEFDNSPKYSVIHFYAAVELFLKARLMLEHWTLVVARPDTADLNKFLSGDFQSVTLKEAKSRLELVVQDGISQQQYECFRKIADHRNRMVHFFHTQPHGKKAQRQSIAAEQCEAWYHLHRLLSQQWVNEFADFQRRIKKFDRTMLKHRHYLSAKFECIRTDIKEMSKEGITFRLCPSCKHKALKEGKLSDSILTYSCMVCSLNTCGVQIKCPGCSMETNIIEECRHTCEQCGHKFSPEDIQASLIKKSMMTKDDMESPNSAHCNECAGCNTIVLTEEGIWFCSQCFTLFEPDEIGQCEWCGDYSSGNLENSYLTGCAACDGRGDRD